jgi:hypothetical protein
MPRYELHKIFREMVRWELRNGRLSSWRRRKLVRYAASLRLSAVEAGELIQEVVQAEEHDVQEEADLTEPASWPPATQDGWPQWAKLALALASVVIVELLLAALFVG